MIVRVMTNRRYARRFLRAGGPAAGPGELIIALEGKWWRAGTPPGGLVDFSHHAVAAIGGRRGPMPIPLPASYIHHHLHRDGICAVEMA